jgi:hypothetical protein
MDDRSERLANEPESRHLESAGEPRKLLHVLQGWPPRGPNFFRWENGRLVFDGEWGADHSFVPRPERWAEFWSVCDEIDIWSWPSKVGDPHMIDGLQYEIEIDVGSRSVKSRGQVIGSPAGFRERLTKVHEALQSLVRWRRPFGRLSWMTQQVLERGKRAARWRDETW